MQPSTAQMALGGLNLELERLAELVGVTRPASVVPVAEVGVSSSVASDVVPSNARWRSEVGVTVVALIGVSSDGAVMGGEEKIAAAPSPRDVRLAGVKRRRWVRGDASASSASIFSFSIYVLGFGAIFCARKSRVD